MDRDVFVAAASRMDPELLTFTLYAIDSLGHRFWKSRPWGTASRNPEATPGAPLLDIQKAAPGASLLEIPKLPLGHRFWES